MNFRKLKIISCIILIIYILYFLVEYFFIPQSINITSGEEYIINLNSPFSAKITPLTAQTLYVNDKKVEDNIDVELDDNIVMSGDTGSGNISVRFFGIPLKNISLNMNEAKKISPVGKAVGICVNTKGVLVLGTGQVRADDGKEYEPAKEILKSGDIITKINGREIKTKEDLLREVAAVNKSISVTYLRDSREYNSDINIVKSSEDGKNKIGLWVRDSTQGIGTLTYYDKQTGRFGALGHPINDVDTGKLMVIDDGEILEAKIDDCQTGVKGTPGALIGSVDFDKTVGVIDKNTNIGIYGNGFEQYFDSLNLQEYPVGYIADIKKGSAYILANIEGKEIKPYSINIENINKYEINSSKSFTFTVTDEELINKTGGIVQGMSGCPIIQNNKIIGAVTHVFVNNPSKGYGIFIENMIKN